MAIDIRAEVSCSLGTVISGSFADDYLQANGLIKTRGEVVLDGTQTPVVGTEVTFTYAKGGTTYTLPRVLRVLSSFADPFRRTTTVQLGCKLTYLENRKPPVTDPNAKDEHSDVPCKVFLKAMLPLSADYVFQQCLDALDLHSASIPLTNKYSVEEFDLSPGFIQVMGDLLQSEGYVGYLDSSETLQFLDLTEDSAAGPVITPADVVDLGPIGVGDLPGESVVVRFNSLRLLPPDELYGDDYLKRSWEIEEVFGAPSEVSVSYTNDAGTTITDDDVFYPYSFTATRYDVWDRKIESIALNIVSSAETNNRWASDALRTGRAWNVPAGKLVREVIEYQKAAAPANSVNLLSVQQVGGGVDFIKSALSIAAEAHTGLANLCIEEVPEGADVVKSQTTYNYFSELELAGSLNIDTYIDNSGSLEEFDTIAGELDSTVVVEYETDATSGISKTITKRTISRSQTVSGQQDLATRAQDLDTTDLTNSIASLLNLARSQVYIGADTSLHTQREYGLQKRPSESDRNNTANTKPVVTEQKAEIAWVTGSTSSTAVTEFTVPYAPDDEITWDESTGAFSSTPSDAKEKALRYGRIQNKLLLGNRTGVSLQLAPEQLPKRPFDPLYLQAGGITGAYRVNGTSWAFDASGIVASTDALLWGAVSATAGTDLSSSWVALAPGTTSLPLPYTPTSSGLDSETGVTYSAVITPTTVLPPYKESVLLDGISRSTAAVTDYPYTLDRGTSNSTLRSRSTAAVSSVAGPIVPLVVKPGLGDVTVVYPGAGDRTEQRTLSLGLAPAVVKYEAPFIAFGHTDTVATGGDYLTLSRVYANSIQNITTSLSTQPTARIVDVAVSPDGTRLAYLQRNEPYFGWYSISDYTFTAQSTPADQPAAYGQMVFNPTGQYLLTEQGFDPPYAQVFRVISTGFEEISNPFDVAPDASVEGFGYSADDRYLALAYGTTLRIYERTGDTYTTVTTATLAGAAEGLGWSPEGDYLAVGVNAGSFVEVYSFDGSTLSSATTGVASSGRVRDLKFSPDGNYLVVAAGVSTYLRFYKRTGTTFTELTSGIPTTGTSPRAIAWMGFSDYFVVQNSGSQGLVWSVDTSSDTFTQTTGSPITLPADTFATNSMTVFPQPAVTRTLATDQTATVLTRLGLSAVAFDPNSPQAFQTVNAAPRLGATPATSSTGWTLIQDANDDDTNTGAISLPFNVTIDGTSHNTVYVSSNSYLTFGEGSGDIPSDASWPEIDKLFIVAGDLSYQRVYTQVGSNYALIRYEGFSDYSGTSPGSSDVMWEVALTAPDGGTGAQVIEVRIGNNNALPLYIGMRSIEVCNTTTSLASVAEAAQNTSYIIEGDSTGATWTFTTGASLTAI